MPVERLDHNYILAPAYKASVEDNWQCSYWDPSIGLVGAGIETVTFLAKYESLGHSANSSSWKNHILAIT